MTDVSQRPRKRFRRGLTKFDPTKHARFKTAEQLGFKWPTPTYPIDNSGRSVIGDKGYGMDGNGPDTTLTVNGGQDVGNCGVCAVPAHSDMIAAVLYLIGALPANTLTSNQVVTLYFIYQAQLAGISWRPSGNDWVAPKGLDNGVDLGDWLLWLFGHDINGNPAAPGEGLIEGFVKLNPGEEDAALALGFIVIAGVNLNPQADQQVEDGEEWDIGPGDQPDPEDGHAIDYVAAVSSTGPNGWITWGQYQPSSGRWKNACPQQWFALLTKEQATSVSFPFAAAVTDLHELNGTAVPDAPNPTPVAPPAPNPAPAPPAPDPTPPAPAPVPTPPTPPVHPDPEWAQWWEDFLAWLDTLVDAVNGPIEIEEVES